MKIGEPFIQFATIESTNNYATDQAKKGLAAAGTAWFAHAQTAGKGQRGRSWQTAEGQNIILSVLLDATFLPLSRQWYLSMAVALAAYDLFSRYAGDETSVKWPNDIYWRDRKAAGILIENVVQGNKWQWAVAGIGMNINQTSFPPEAKNPVSLRQVTGKAFDPVVLARELCGHMHGRLQQLQSDAAAVLQAFNEHLFKRGDTNRFRKGNQQFTALVQGVNEQGQLLLQAGAEMAFSHGEVEWITS